MNKLFAFAVVAAAGVATSAMAQTPTYEFRIVMDGDGAAGTIANPAAGVVNLPNGQQVTAIGFWIQARVSLANPTSTNTNRGIGRFTSPAGLPSVVSVTDPVGAGTINRGQIGTSDGPDFTPATGDEFGLFGRAPGFRAGGPLNQDGTDFLSDFDVSPWHSANLNGDVNPNPGSSLNAHGVVNTTLDTITGIDSWAGSNLAPAARPTFAANTFSPWYNLYRFVWVAGDTNTGRTVVINAAGQLSYISRITATATQLGTSALAEATYTFNYVVPTPGAAALIGLGGLAVARRRRA